ncbi:DUF1772 domain-containing protein [Actinophytocola sp. NPDC049390]|uniref:DUF1772 domain-containing protein n=1 Tax=Actinophytocola sp. NPDC049390 TaxID=3363894 RepID=UPI00379CFD7B
MVVLTLVVALVNLVLLGAVYGVFFAYSNSVVPGLDRVEHERAAAAMRGMNVVIVNPRFLATFVGPVVTAAATGFLLLALDETTAALLYLAAAVVYLLGALVVTGRVNVPMNNALDGGSLSWSEYAARWRRWNTVRTVSSMVALVLCGVGLYVWGS